MKAIQRKWLVLMFIFALTLSACSSSTSGVSGGEDSGADSSGEVVNLKFTFWGSPSEAKAQEAAVEQFNELYKGKIHVEPVHIATSYDEKLTTMIAGNEAPDVAFLESATLAYPLAEQGKLLNVLEFVATDGEIDEAAFAANNSFYWEPDKLLGYGAAPEAFQLFYNVEMFEEAGIQPPPADPAKAWDWDTFVETAKKLTIDQNGNNALSPSFDPNKISQYGFNMPLWWAAWGGFVIGNGGDFVTKDGKIGLTQPEAIEVFQKISDLMNVHHVMPSPVQAKSLPATNVSLQTKKVAMTIDGAWINLDLSNIKVPYAIGALPKMSGESKSLVVTAAVGIFASTKHPQEAWTFYKHILNPESVLDLITGGLWMPTLSSWYSDDALLSKWAEGNPAHPAGFKENIKGVMVNGHGHPTPTAYVKNFNGIMEQIGPALDKVWLGEQSAEEALKQVEEAAQKEVQGRRDQ